MSGLKFNRHLQAPQFASPTNERGINDLSEDDRRPPADKVSGLREQLFTVVNLAVFLVLLACVAVAAVLWELWH